MKEKNENHELKLGEIAKISSGIVINRLKSLVSHNMSDKQEIKGKKYYYITQKSVSDNKIESKEFESNYFIFLISTYHTFYLYTFYIYSIYSI